MIYSISFDQAYASSVWVTNLSRPIGFGFSYCRSKEYTLNMSYSCLVEMWCFNWGSLLLRSQIRG